MFAIVRVRGGVKTAAKIKDTLSMLRLTRVNHCTLMPETPDVKGMLQRAHDYITWGPVSEELAAKLIAKRGRLAGDRRVPETDAPKHAKAILEQQHFRAVAVKPVFRLSPPSHGYRGIKMPYPKGDLGFRGEKISELLERMM